MDEVARVTRTGITVVDMGHDIAYVTETDEDDIDTEDSFAAGTPLPAIGRATKSETPALFVDHRLYRVAELEHVDDEFYVWCPDLESAVEATRERATLRGLPWIYREIAEVSR